jgi:hypothetical protein
MKPIVSKSFFSPEGVCVNVVSESAFTLPFTVLFGCKMFVLKMYLMWEGGSPGPSACNEGGHQHARREAARGHQHARREAISMQGGRQPGAISMQGGRPSACKEGEAARDHPWPSVAIRGHQRPIWTRTGRTIH